MLLSSRSQRCSSRASMPRRRSAPASSYPDSRHRSRSSRIPPTSRSSSWSSRAAAFASSRTACSLARTSSISRRRSVRRRAGPARPRVPARLRDQRPLLRQLHRPAGEHGGRPLPAIGWNPLVADAASRFDLRWPPGGDVHRAAVRESQRRQSGVRSGRLPLIGLGDGGSGDDPE